MDSLSDPELVARARGGDRQAFDELVHRYQSLTLRVARGMVPDAEIARDLAQEAMLQAYLSLAHLQDHGRFRSWLHGIVRNVCRSYLRDRKAEWLSLETVSGGLQVDAAGWPGHGSDPSAAAEQREQARMLLGALDDLPPKDREVARLFYERQLSLREIAASTGCSVAAVKNRLYRARRQLRARLASVYPEMLGAIVAEGRTCMVKVTVNGVIEEERPGGRSAAVILVDEGGRRALRIAMGPADVAAIDLGLRRLSLPRPMTFGLMAEMLRASGSKLEEVRIEALKEGVFYAVAKLRRGKTARELDARPSDALALALQTGSPIYVAETIMGQAGQDLPDSLEVVPAARTAAAVAPGAPIPERLPVIPMRDGVYFPRVIAPIFMGRQKTLRALEEAQSADRSLLLLTQKDSQVDDPQAGDLYSVGTVARLMDVLRLPDGTARVMIEGQARARVREYLQTEPFHCARIELLVAADEPATGQEAAIEAVLSRYSELSQQGKLGTFAPAASTLQEQDAGRIADTLAAFLPASVQSKQEILEITDPVQRLEKVRAYLQ